MLQSTKQDSDGADEAPETSAAVNVKVEPDAEDPEETYSERPIDYFVVFGVHPPKEFEKVDFGRL